MTENKPKLEDIGLPGIILFALTVVTFVIGVDQTIRNGILESYWIFTFSVGFMLLYNWLRQRRQPGKTIEPELPVKKTIKKRRVAGKK
jgi:hypothetical protein